MFNLEDVFCCCWQWWWCSRVSAQSISHRHTTHPGMQMRNEVKSDNDESCRVSMYSMTLLENKVILRFQSWLMIVILVVWVDVLFSSFSGAIWRMKMMMMGWTVKRIQPTFIRLRFLSYKVFCLFIFLPDSLFLSPSSDMTTSDMTTSDDPPIARRRGWEARRDGWMDG